MPALTVDLDRRRRETVRMRFPNDIAFHLRMAALLIASMFLEHLADTRLPNWSSPRIGVITFVLGLAWVAMAAFHHAKATQAKLRLLEDRLEQLDRLTEALVDDERRRRSLPPMHRSRP